MSTCRSCGARITWVKTSHGKNIPVDEDPGPEGNIIVVGQEAHVFRSRPDYLTLLKLGLPDDTPRYVSHFATCPQAKEWRGRGLGKT